MKDFRVALVQCGPTTTGPHEENLDLVDTHLREASANGADLVVFPEVTLTGYATTPERVRERALSLDSPIVGQAIALSKIHSVCCSIGLFERSGDRIYDTVLLAGKGELIGAFRKVHVPARERGLFTPGPGFEVFQLPFAKVGFAICYDNEFPESHTILALQGAELIVMPYAWAEHWEKQDYIEPSASDDEVIAERRRWMVAMFGARCRDSGTYSVMVDHAGLEDGGPWRFVGKSMAFAPTGKVIAETAGWKEEVVYADLSGQLLEAYRNMDCYVLKARRPDAYGPLVDPAYAADR